MSLTLPVQNTERVAVLDVLRGFALFGIMFINMTWFTGFAVLSPDQRTALGTADMDKLVYWLIHVLVDGKFWSLFALLFGVGVAIQFNRAQRDEFTRTYLRRIMVLLTVGLAHAVLLWFGDIVSLYAVVGLVLLFFVNRSERTVLIWSGILLLAPIVQLGITLSIYNLQPQPSVVLDPGHGPAELFRSFSSGTYLEAFQANWEFLKERWAIAVYDGRFMKLSGMLLLGWWAGKRGMFRRAQSFRHLWKTILIAGATVGLTLNITIYTLYAGVSLRPPSLDGWIVEILKTFGTPTLCLAYVAAITLMCSANRPRIGLSSILAAAGRMSLTNYIMQSAIGILIFYGYGFQNWGKFGATWSIAFIVVIFGLQLAVSFCWLKHFRQGPLEWICRCVTYGRWLPFTNQSVETNEA